MDYDSEKGAMKTQKNTLSARFLIKDFVFSQTPDRIIRSIYRWKNVGRKFDEQLDAAEALYGVQVQFDFSMKDLENEITRLAEKYSPVICERIQQLMRQQFRKYKYLIKQK